MYWKLINIFGEGYSNLRNLKNWKGTASYDI